MKNEIQQSKIDKNKIDLIKNTVAKGATDDELKLFLYQATRSGLDPLTRQIYFVKRGDKVTIQTSIDGFRIIAERSGFYAGQDAPEFITKNNRLYKCSVSVYRFNPETNERYKAAVGVAYWEEYCPDKGLDFMWNKMPHTMLSKVAEALALRKAFPQDLSGLYSSEEMEQSSNQQFGGVEKQVEDVKSNSVVPNMREKTYEVEPNTPDKKVCPKCGSQLVERKSKYGGTFWGCSGYPLCAFILRENKEKVEIEKADEEVFTEEEFKNLPF
ncbi:MAG TPA: phage recombination protein Bet [Bacteroidia bacterium]|nr:phage recombination protein Bet [Bacteroidia bacterium]